LVEVLRIDAGWGLVHALDTLVTVAAAAFAGGTEQMTGRK
jgi:hypothetical protein